MTDQGQITVQHHSGTKNSHLHPVFSDFPKKQHEAGGSFLTVTQVKECLGAGYFLRGAWYHCITGILLRCGRASGSGITGRCWADLRISRETG